MEKRIIKGARRQEKAEKPVKDKYDKQLLTILVVIGIVFIIIFSIWILVQKSKKFEYGGVNFEKIIYGKLPLYYSPIDITRSDGSKVRYNLYLRNDPRANNIPIDADINFKLGKIYVTSDEGVGKCEDTTLALVNLGSFLSGMGFQPKGASSNEQIAEQYNAPYVTCWNNIGITILSLETAEDEMKISQDKGNPNCYILRVKDCNMINITEKFITETIKQKFVKT